MKKKKQNRGDHRYRCQREHSSVRPQYTAAMRVGVANEMSIGELGKLSLYARGSETEFFFFLVRTISH